MTDMNWIPFQDSEEQVKKTVKFFHEKLMCFDKYSSEGAEEKLDALKWAVQNHYYAHFGFSINKLWKQIDEIAREFLGIEY